MATKKAEPAVEAKTTAAEKPAEKATTTAAAKPAAKKAPAKKPAAKKAEATVAVTVEFGGKAVKAQDVLAMVKKEIGRKKVETLEIYINTDANKAYYVLNGKGGDDMFVEL